MRNSDPLIGHPAPPFTLPSTMGGDYTPPLGDKPIVLFFFPTPGTFGCTVEACSLRDAQEKNPSFQRHPNLEIVGITSAPVEKSLPWIDQHGLPFRILSDADGTVQHAYGIGKALFGSTPERKTVFIAADGRVKATHTANLNFWSHTRFIEAQLDSLLKGVGDEAGAVVEDDSNGSGSNAPPAPHAPPAAAAVSAQ